jgi:hypothetical protein
MGKWAKLRRSERAFSETRSADKILVQPPLRAANVSSGASPIRHFAHSPRTFHACNVRARVMKTAVEHSGGADLNHERETENFSMGSGNGGGGSRNQRYRRI